MFSLSTSNKIEIPREMGKISTPIYKELDEISLKIDNLRSQIDQRQRQPIVIKISQGMRDFRLFANGCLIVCGAIYAMDYYNGTQRKANLPGFGIFFKSCDWIGSYLWDKIINSHDKELTSLEKHESEIKLLLKKIETFSKKIIIFNEILKENNIPSDCLPEIVKNSFKISVEENIHEILPDLAEKLFKPDATEELIDQPQNT